MQKVAVLPSESGEFLGQEPGPASAAPALVQDVWPTRPLYYDDPKPMPGPERDGVVGEFDRLALSDRDGSVRLNVHVRPRSSRSGVVGVRDGALDVALLAPPAEGAANAELVRVLAKAVGIRKSDVTIVLGTSSRTKVVEFRGLNAGILRTRLGEAKR